MNLVMVLNVCQCSLKVINANQYGHQMDIILYHIEISLTCLCKHAVYMKYRK